MPEKRSRVWRTGTWGTSLTTVIPEVSDLGIHCLMFLQNKHIIKEDNVKQPAVYILANKKHGTIYIGVTSNLIKRIWQHKNHVVSGFTESYSVNMLVYFEQYDDMENALKREKQLKAWNRAWKIKLIEKNNSSWNDLYENII